MRTTSDDESGPSSDHSTLSDSVFLSSDENLSLIQFETSNLFDAILVRASWRNVINIKEQMMMNYINCENKNAGHFSTILLNRNRDRKIQNKPHLTFTIEMKDIKEIKEYTGYQNIRIYRQLKDCSQIYLTYAHEELLFERQMGFIHLEFEIIKLLLKKGEKYNYSRNHTVLKAQKHFTHIWQYNWLLSTLDSLVAFFNLYQCFTFHISTQQKIDNIRNVSSHLLNSFTESFGTYNVCSLVQANENDTRMRFHPMNWNTARQAKAQTIMTGIAISNHIREKYGIQSNWFTERFSQLPAPSNKIPEVPQFVIDFLAEKYNAAKDKAILHFILELSAQKIGKNEIVHEYNNIISSAREKNKKKKWDYSSNEELAVKYGYVEAVQFCSKFNTSFGKKNFQTSELVKLSPFTARIALSILFRTRVQEIQSTVKKCLVQCLINAEQFFKGILYVGEIKQKNLPAIDFHMSPDNYGPVIGLVKRSVCEPECLTDYSDAFIKLFERNYRYYHEQGTVHYKDINYRYQLPQTLLMAMQYVEFPKNGIIMPYSKSRHIRKNWMILPIYGDHQVFQEIAYRYERYFIDYDTDYKNDLFTYDMPLFEIIMNSYLEEDDHIVPSTACFMI